jgi:hypothetical protein
VAQNRKRLVKVRGGGVEVLVAALHPGVAPVEVAAGMGAEYPPPGLLDEFGRPLVAVDRVGRGVHGLAELRDPGEGVALRG